MDKRQKMQALQEKATHINDNNEHKGLGSVALADHYRIQSLSHRRAAHLSFVMLRLSNESDLLDKSRPKINLQNRNNLKFKSHKRSNEKYVKCPLSGGVTYPMGPDPRVHKKVNH